MALWNKKLRYHQRLFLWLLLYSLLFTGCFTAFQYSREKEFKQQELNSASSAGQYAFIERSGEQVVPSGVKMLWMRVLFPLLAPNS